MDPTREEKQNEPPQQKSGAEGRISQGINAINKLAGGGFKNPLGGIGSKVVAQTALRGFVAFLAGPGFPIAITLGLVLFFVLIIIMGFGGAPSSEPNGQTANITPTETPTPTPPAP